MWPRAYHIFSQKGFMQMPKLEPLSLCENTKAKKNKKKAEASARKLSTNDTRNSDSQKKHLP